MDCIVSSDWPILWNHPCLCRVEIYGEWHLWYLEKTARLWLSQWSTMKEETTCLPWFPGSCLKRATYRGSQISEWHWTCACHSLILLTLTCSTVKLCTVSCKNFVVKEKICLKQKILMKSFIIRYTKHRNNTTSKLCLLVQEKCTGTCTHVWVCQQQLELYRAAHSDDTHACFVSTL